MSIIRLGAKTTAYWRQILRDTITMKDAECQARVERIFKEISRISHIDEDWEEKVKGIITPREKVCIYWEDLQALKKREGVK